MDNNNKTTNKPLNKQKSESYTQNTQNIASF